MHVLVNVVAPKYFVPINIGICYCCLVEGLHAEVCPLTTVAIRHLRRHVPIRCNGAMQNIKVFYGALLRCEAQI